MVDGCRDEMNPARTLKENRWSCPDEDGNVEPGSTSYRDGDPGRLLHFGRRKRWEKEAGCVWKWFVPV